MAETSVIKEFLVALGFKTDEPALKNFEAGIGKATKAVVGLAAAIEGTAIAVAAGVARFASNLEALYFASIRTGSAATNLKAFDLAAQNFGASAGEAQASVEGLAHALRVNPGNEGLLQSFGIQTRNAKGGARDLTDVMMDLAKVFAGQPIYIAEQYASMLGISENTLLAMRNGDFAAEMAKRQAQMKNSGFDQATKDAHAFSEQMRKLGVYLQAFGLQVYDALSKKLGVSVEGLTTWLQKNGPWLANRIVYWAGLIIRAAEWIGQKIEWIVGKLKSWDSATDGWSTKLLGLLVVMKLFGGAELIGGVLKLAAAFLRLGAGVASAAAASSAGWLGALLGVGGAAAGGVGLGWALDKYFPNNPLARLGEKIGGAMYDGLHRKEDALMFFQNHGWTRDQAAGIVANLQAESGFSQGKTGDNGRAYGIAQWHPDRQADFRRWSGHDIHGSSYEEQLAFVQHELETSQQHAAIMLRAAQNADQAGRAVSRYYERPWMADAQAARRGASAVSIAQNTTIHVNGGDPAATGRAVAGEQSRVNATLARNMAVAVQ